MECEGDEAQDTAACVPRNLFGFFCFYNLWYLGTYVGHSLGTCWISSWLKKIWLSRNFQHVGLVLRIPSFLRICSILQGSYIHITSSTLPPRPIIGYEPSASFSNPSKLMLFGRSIGSPNARSQISCASGPRPRETPKVAV